MMNTVVCVGFLECGALLAAGVILIPAAGAAAIGIGAALFVWLLERLP